LFGLILIAANWREYKHILLPRIKSRQPPELQSLRRGPGQ
jgi:hypothetical protein